MNDSKDLEIDPAANGNVMFFDDYEFPGYDGRNNGNSESLSDVLKFYVLRIALDGAEKLVKDKRSWNTRHCFNQSNFSCEASRQFSTENGKTWSSSPKPCRAVADSKSSIRALPARKHEFDHDDINASVLVKSPPRGCIWFPMNCIALFAMFLMKLVGYQFNLFVSFVTFPLWLSYFSVMSLMFPFQTMKRVRGYVIKKLLTMLGASSSNVKVKVQKSALSVAMKFGWGFLTSIYVCCVLFLLLASSFLFGGLMMRCIVEKPIQATENLNFDYSQPSPVAFVPMMTGASSGDTFGLVPNDNLNTEKAAGERFVPYNHKLQLTVSLMLPESEYNRKLGVFQVNVQFLSASGKVIASSRRPSMLLFKSQSIRFAETMIKSAPLIAGVQSESQVLNIRMNEFTEGLEPTACLKVTIEQRAEFKSGAGIPEIYAASLVLESQLPLLKKMVWQWRRTIFVWISFTWFFTELIAILLFCRSMIMPRGRPTILYHNKGVQFNKIPWYKTY